MSNTITLMTNVDLKHHERVSIGHVKALMREIQSDGYIRDPIIVDKKSLIILDGHHRSMVAKRLGLLKIPVYFVDYMDASIVVASWRDGETVTKEVVLKAGITGTLLRSKTSKHTVPNKPSNICIPLKLLQ